MAASGTEYFNSVGHFCQCTDALLKLEREAELDETRALQENVSPKLLEKRGICITKLNIDSRKTSLYGRQILTFKPSNVNRQELPSHSITTGDILGLHLASNPLPMISSGIVTRVASSHISVAFDQSAELSDLGSDVQYYVVKLANDVTYRRLRRALDKLSRGKALPADRLIDLAFSSATCDVPSNLKADDINLFNTHLDASQKDSVLLALSQPTLAIIHGPPGTGKSTTLIEVIRQHVAKGLKVLACAPSNVAVDNLVLRLSKAKVKVTRLGHPARAMHEIQPYSLDAKVSASDDRSIVEDIKRDIDATLKRMRGKSTSQSVRTELKTLRTELRRRSDEAVRRVLKNSDVILSTLTSATDDGPLKILEDMHFDVVVIDECSQALEAACWIALIQSRKCILAGDHLQLPPTILSRQAASLGLSVTLMERLIPLHPNNVNMLTVQYRMNSAIMQWASQELYSSKVTAADSVADHLLTDLPEVEDNENTCEPLLLIDTAGCDLQELDLPDEQSRGNEGEADLVAIHVESLIKSGVKSQDIAVISPYNLQVELIRNRLSDKYRDLEIKSVDGYQGREKEAVIISLVRSNTRGEVGFLSEDRRLNVAVTRARRQVTIVCDSVTVSKHAFLARLITYMNEKGVVKSAAEYQIDHDIGKLSDKVVEMMKKKSDETGSVNKSAKSSKASSDSQKPRVKNKKVATVSVLSHESAASSTADQTIHKANAISETEPKESKEEREERIRQEMSEIVSRFIHSDNLVHHLTTELNSYQRMIAHQIAESYELEHSSKGEGADRHIVLKKPPRTKTEKLSRELPASQIQGPRDVKEDDGVFISAKAPVAVASDVTSCDKCGSLVPKANLALHELRCSTVPATKQTTVNSQQSNSSTRPKTANTTQPAPNSAKSKKKKKEKKTIDDEAILNKVDGDDFDALLAAADRLNSVCNYRKCKTLVKTLGTNCAHCKLRFCLTHGMPEVHGCGDAVKIQARINISREGKLYNGSGMPNKKPNATTRAQLEKKLQSKMSKFTEQRKPKEKDNS